MPGLQQKDTFDSRLPIKAVIRFPEPIECKFCNGLIEGWFYFYKPQVTNIQAKPN